VVGRAAAAPFLAAPRRLPAVIGACRLSAAAARLRPLQVGLLAYSPLAGGALSGKYISSNPASARFNLFPG
jgi:hypothetical protein